MPAWVLLTFPTDFVRVFWVVTVFDIVAAAYLLHLAFSGAIPLGKGRVMLRLGAVFFAFVLANALANPFYIEENFVLLAGTALSMVKALALCVAIERSEQDPGMVLGIGFTGVNLLLLVYYVLGFGLTGSGRFAGFFGSSNGLSAFATFALATALYIATRAKPVLGAVSAVLAVTVILLTGSRGALVYAIVTCAVWFLIRPIMLKKRVTAASLAILCALTLLLVFLNDAVLVLATGLDTLDIEGVRRLTAFLRLFNEIGFASNLDEARADLNAVVLNTYFRAPSFWGFGYSSSAVVTGVDQRAHNILVVALYELGVPVLLGVLVLFVRILRFIWINLPSSGVHALHSLWGLLVMLNALKTPYYFLNGVSWLIILLVFLPGRGHGTDSQLSYARS